MERSNLDRKDMVPAAFVLKDMRPTKVPGSVGVAAEMLIVPPGYLPLSFMVGFVLSTDLDNPQLTIALESENSQRGSKTWWSGPMAIDAALYEHILMNPTEALNFMVYLINVIPKGVTKLTKEEYDSYPKIIPYRDLRPTSSARTPAWVN